MGDSSTEDLSRELSNISVASANGSSTTQSSSPTKSERSSHRSKHDGVEVVDDTYSDDDFDKSSDNENADDASYSGSRKDLARESTGVSLQSEQSNSSSGATGNAEEADYEFNNGYSSREGSQLPSRENTVQSQNSTRENTMTSENSTRENTITSEKRSITRESLNQDESRESSMVTGKLSRAGESSSNDHVSRETTKLSDEEHEADGMSKENTMSNGSEYQDDFETSRESTMSTNEPHSWQEVSFINQPDNDQPNNDELEAMEKEESVLIERDGKFKLVNPSELEAEDREMLGLPTISTVQKTKEHTKGKKERLHLGAAKIPEYSHATSTYGLTDTQRAMKKRRISVRQMRLDEEKKRLLEEEERQKIANHKSYTKWLTEKRDTTHKPSKKELAENAANEERQMAAEKSYRMWLKVKEKQQKEERKMEKFRLADEAEHYIVRDRAVCERSFQLWLKQKKQDEISNRITIMERPRRKAAIKPKSATHKAWIPVNGLEPVSKEKRPQSFVKNGTANSRKPHYATMEQLSLAKLNRRSAPKVRYTETVGYRHPASIDDLLS